MAQKLNLDFSIGESIVKGIKGTPEVRIDSVNINETDVPLAGDASSLINTVNNTLDLVTKNVESANHSYYTTINIFKDIQENFKETSVFGHGLLVGAKEE